MLFRVYRNTLKDLVWWKILYEIDDDATIGRWVTDPSKNFDCRIRAGAPGLRLGE